jgi:hypothetical protein
MTRCQEYRVLLGRTVECSRAQGDRIAGGKRRRKRLVEQALDVLVVRPRKTVRDPWVCAGGKQPPVFVRIAADDRAV